MTTTYRIVVRPQVGTMVSDVFPSIVALHEGDHTILEGPVTDQAELHGILRVLHDLHATIVSVAWTTASAPRSPLHPG